jgi:hypothetical protein
MGSEEFARRWAEWPRCFCDRFSGTAHMWAPQCPAWGKESPDELERKGYALRSMGDAMGRVARLKREWEASAENAKPAGNTRRSDFPNNVGGAGAGADTTGEGDPGGGR